MFSSQILSIFSENYSFSGLIVTGVAGIALGYFFKQAIILKQKKRILTLEDEMLNNHSRILSLEKRVAEAKKETNNNHHYNGEILSQKKVELKAS